MALAEPNPYSISQPVIKLPKFETWLEPLRKHPEKLLEETHGVLYEMHGQYRGALQLAWSCGQLIEPLDSEYSRDPRAPQANSFNLGVVVAGALCGPLYVLDATVARHAAANIKTTLCSIARADPDTTDALDRLARQQLEPKKTEGRLALPEVTVVFDELIDGLVTEDDLLETAKLGGGLIKYGLWKGYETRQEQLSLLGLGAILSPKPEVD